VIELVPQRHSTGALDRSRTYDLRFRKPTLYPLSYEGVEDHVSGATSKGLPVRGARMRAGSATME